MIIDYLCICSKRICMYFPIYSTRWKLVQELERIFREGFFNKFRVEWASTYLAEDGWCGFYDRLSAAWKADRLYNKQEVNEMSETSEKGYCAKTQ